MTPYAFFLKWAGFSYDPKTETKEQGRRRCARLLATAEKAAREAGVSFKWEIDPLITSADWLKSYEDGGKYRAPWETWVCSMYDEAGDLRASLGGIDFGRGGNPYESTYRRVVEAELATEYEARDVVTV